MNEMAPTRKFRGTEKRENNRGWFFRNECGTKESSTKRRRCGHRQKDF